MAKKARKQIRNYNVNENANISDSVKKTSPWENILDTSAFKSRFYHSPAMWI